ncbi:CpsB/CapC family capsule biosynthesis tyrosine phosphatase [Flavobacteriaceae bacterium S356]|uniref:protein-tyrosine-phosphatase n=1 Tax=Asprobacillus argus TaxID=3076534 RepID=A0ABU3LI84_9FLAO|nr:CpsB/CapC family capsule biosynthesis tyrosine phosphatase [Flavobacteriaceae bacterium S356]
MIFKKKKQPIIDLFDDNFVDIHSHLLPGIDDGAKSINNSIELIQKMHSFGIKNFITTPHVLGDLYPNSTETIKEKLLIIQKELANRGMNDVAIRASAEYMMDEQFSDRLEAGDILPLKDNLILVEMSYFNAPLNLYDILFEIQLKGYKPILAHPERYNFYHQEFANYYKLKKAGCLFQLNILSLTDHYGKGVRKISEKLLNLGMYDFVGTDTHHIGHLILLEKINNSKADRAKLLELFNKNNFFI